MKKNAITNYFGRGSGYCVVVCGLFDFVFGGCVCSGRTAKLSQGALLYGF
jgi:hypothetical protein